MNKSGKESECKTDLEEFSQSADENDNAEPREIKLQPTCYIGKLKNDSCDIQSTRGKILSSEVFKIVQNLSHTIYLTLVYLRSWNSAIMLINSD